jgi:GT2 family glycosyltransferase
MAEDYDYSYPELVRRATFVESQSLPGRGTLIPTDVFDKIGLYDSKHYIHYLSDIEFSVRAQKAGYRLIVNVASLVYEYVNSTSSLITHQAGWKEFWQGFTSIKSPTNLKIRYRFAVTHSRTKQFYFVCDVSRICAGFLLRKMRSVKPV